MPIPVSLVVAALLCGVPGPALACEPLPPLLVLFAFPSYLTGAVTGWLGFVAGLVAGIGIKCAAFAYWEPALLTGRAVWLMCLANLMTTGVGLFTAIALTFPPLLFLLPVLYGCTV
jgi:hypothetical protein